LNPFLFHDPHKYPEILIQLLYNPEKVLDRVMVEVNLAAALNVRFCQMIRS